MQKFCLLLLGAAASGLCLLPLMMMMKASMERRITGQNSMVVKLACLLFRVLCTSCIAVMDLLLGFVPAVASRLLTVFFASLPV